MNEKIKNSIFFLLILAIIINVNFLHNLWLGILLGLLYLSIWGFLSGEIMFRAANKAWQLIIGLFFLISLYSLLGAIIYYFYQLNQLSISILFIIISTAIIILKLKIQQSEFKIKRFIDSLANSYNMMKPRITSYNIILVISYLILFAISIYLLCQSQTIQPINSPWQIIPPAFFIIYFIASLNLVLLILFNKNFISSFLISLHFFLTGSVALIIYKLGYGFDPFIHQATEQVIWEQGFILPKPFYYLGQYSLVIFLAHLFQASVEWIDRLLVPFFLGLFIPYFIYSSLNKAFGWQKYISRLLSLCFLFLPFTLLIATNPQALANIFTIITLFLSFLYLKNKIFPYHYLLFLTFTTLLIHPISGLPILIYIILIKILQFNFKFKKIIITLLAAIACLILPLTLFINSLISIYKIKIDIADISLIKLPDIFSRQFNYFLDIAYIYQNFIYLAFILIALIVFIYLAKQKKAAIFTGAVLTFLILIINSFLLKLIKVSFIIGNEQQFFSQRVWQLSFYFLLPLIIYGLYLFISKSEKNHIYRLFIILLFTIILTCSLYISYPRYDNYDNSNFINLSYFDLEAVKFIEKNSLQKDYIVLSQQMTSAAALKIFGFSRYYNEQYFYPIPTGGPLYQYFEKMAYDAPDKQTVLAAMDLTGVNTAYFVLPFYWSNFQQLSKQAEKSADAVYNLADKIMIYKYFR